MATGRDRLVQAWNAFQAGRYAEAETIYRQILEADAENADVWCTLGVVCSREGNLDGAADCHRRALALRPQYFEATLNLGNVLWRQGAIDEAIAQYQEALRLKPASAEAHNNLGAAFRQQGRWTEAVSCYEEALRLNPAYADAQNNFGSVLLALGRTDDAVLALQRACQLRPDFSDAQNNLATALRKQGKSAEATDLLELLVRRDPAHAEAHFNLAGRYADQGDFRRAMASCRQAIAARPKYAEAHYRLALLLQGEGNSAEARAEFQATIESEPTDPDGHLCRALARLLLGDYRQGWDEYEWRWRSAEFVVPPIAQPLWDGSPLAGRSVLIHFEQGLGDTIQFIRYAPLVRHRGGRVIVACQKALLPLLAACPGIDQLVAAEEPLPAHDFYISMLSLPRIFATTLDTVPAEIPYLDADRDLAARWQRDLGATRGYRVGIVWQGNTRHHNDRCRSVPLEEFRPLGRVPNVQLFSLQKCPGSEQIGTLSEPLTIVDLGPRLDEDSGPFMDTAAIMKSLDLVIAVDTAAAHLAGALGVPVWVPLSATSDWRWLLDRDDSPWYPTMRLFRQSEIGRWDDVFDRMTVELRELACGGERRPVPTSPRAAEIAIPISAGELIDKVTILRIKSDRFADTAKLRNVRHELSALTAVCDRSVPHSPELDCLTNKLRAVNESLWEIEDAIRCCERQGDFGPRFVELARSVYRQNDRRAVLKRAINELVGSTLMEEKGYSGDSPA
jgi:tetratricopeptide (TPR) repeat protein